MHEYDLIIAPLVSLLCIAIGLIVYLNNRENTSGRITAIISISIGFWILTAFFSDITKNQLYSILWNRAIFVSLFFVMGGLLYLPFVFPFRRRFASYLKWLLTIFLIIAGIVTLATPAIVSNVQFENWGSNIIYGNLFMVFAVFAMGAIIVSLVISIINYIKSKPKDRTKLKLFFEGLFLFMLVTVVVHVVIRNIVGSDEYYRFGNYAAIIFVAFTAYAIVKHQLFNIKVILTEIGVAIVGIAILEQIFLSKGLLQIIVNIILFLLVAYGSYLLVQSVKSEIERRKEVEILAEKLTVVNNNLLTLQHINNKMVSTLELRRVAQEIVESLSTELSWKGGFVSLVDEKKETINIAAISKKVLDKISPYLTKQIAEYHLHLAKGGSVLQQCIKKIEIEYSNDFYEVIKGALKKEVAQKIQKVLKIKTFGCAPVVYRGQVIGAIVIGFDKKLAHITQEERKMISAIADQAAIAIENAKLYEEIEAANSKLKELDKLKNEFLSIASHQVRTPLSIIKGYISLLRTKKAGELSAQQNRFMKNIQEANEQLINVINDFLNLSRIEQKRMKLEISKSDIKKIIDEVIERLNHEAELKKIKLEFCAPKEELPKINIDEPKMIEVITNLIDNAIKYSPEGGEVKVRVRRPDKRRLEISVKDNGIGIPESFKDKLFQKFSRAHNAIQAQPNGNGIGLFLVKKIIDAHRGQISVKTKEGKGAIFTVELDYKSGLKPGEEVDANKLEKEGIIRYDEYKDEKPEIRNQNDEKMLK